MISRRALLSLLVPPGAITVAMRARDGAILAVSDEIRARTVLAAPGSAVKPLTLLAMRMRGPFLCKRRLQVAGHSLDCSHPAFLLGVDAESALAWSCNSWFAARATQMDAGSFHRSLLRAGAQADLSRTPDELVLQALGVEGVRFSPLALAGAYRRVAATEDRTVRRGAERAVREGTAQLASVNNLPIAGKTGTSREGSWFAGFAPADAPEVVVSVYVPGGHGATDAAPVARGVFEWWQRSVSSR